MLIKHFTKSVRGNNMNIYLITNIFMSLLRIKDRTKPLYTQELRRVYNCDDYVTT